MSLERDRALIAEGICPFCIAGPFIVPALHVNKAHGMDARALRDYLDYYYSKSICDPTYSQQARERADVSTLGDARPTAGQRKEIGRALSKKRLRLATDRDRYILREIRSTEKTYEEIAAETEMHVRSIRAIAQRNNISIDGRARYHHRFRGQDPPQLQAARQKFVDAAEAERLTARSEYEAGTTVQQLADRRNVTIKHMQQYLKRAGATLPDRRIEANKRRSVRLCG